MLLLTNWLFISHFPGCNGTNAAESANNYIMLCYFCYDCKKDFL